METLKQKRSRLRQQEKAQKLLHRAALALGVIPAYDAQSLASKIERIEKDLFVGGTVVGVITDPDHEYFGLQIRLGGKVRDLWFECDDEQNGPGSFSVGEWTDPDREEMPPTGGAING